MIFQACFFLRRLLLIFQFWVVFVFYWDGIMRIILYYIKLVLEIISYHGDTNSLSTLICDAYYCIVWLLPVNILRKICFSKLIFHFFSFLYLSLISLNSRLWSALILLYGSTSFWQIFSKELHGSHYWLFQRRYKRSGITLLIYYFFRVVECFMKMGIYIFKRPNFPTQCFFWLKICTTIYRIR